MSQNKLSWRKYTFAAVVVLLLITSALVYIWFTQEQKSDPVSEAIFRRYASQKIPYPSRNYPYDALFPTYKDPNELTDEDFAKLRQLLLSQTIEVTDIKILRKFTGLIQLKLDIRYPQKAIPQWMKILAKLGIYNLDKRFTIDLSPLKNMTELKELDLSHSSINNIEALAALSNLENVILFYNKVSDIEPLKHLTKLKTLYINCSLIPDLKHLEKLTNLTDLRITEGQFSDIEPLTKLKNLKILYLQSSHLSNIESLKKLTNLTYLGLRYSQLSDFEPIKNLTNLEGISLEGTPITNLEPIKDMTKLKHLVIEGTKVTSLEPLSGLTNMEELRIDGTDINDLKPLMGLTKLKIVFIRRCPNITTNQVEELRKALPNLSIKSN